jgi:hypothetical protein
MPVILAIWEAEIKRIGVQGQLRQKCLQDRNLNGKKAGKTAHAYHSSEDGKNKIGESRSRLA